MTASPPDPDRIADLEARVAALGSLTKSLLTTLMLRGLLTRAEIAPLVAQAEQLMSSAPRHGVPGAARAELAAVAAELPAYLRAAMGAPPATTITIIEPAAKGGEMLKTLAEKVDPKHAALVLVDVQNDFVAEGGAMHREGRDMSMVQAMLPRLTTLIGQARAAGVKLVWIRNVYNTAPNWYLSEVWREQAMRRRKGAYIQFPVCEAGQWNGDFYGVRPQPDEVIVTKHRYGAFEATDLDLVLRSNGVRTVIMTGAATNVCVETTARQAFLKDYYVVFTSDCTATYRQVDHDATLDNIDQFFGEVAPGADVARCWAGGQTKPARAGGKPRAKSPA